MHNSNEVTQSKMYSLLYIDLGVHKYTSHHLENTNSLRDARKNTTHIVFEGELAVKLRAKDVEVGISANGNPIKNKSPCG